MKNFEDLKFGGAYLVKTNVFGDERGWYSPAFISKKFGDIGFRGVKQVSRSKSNKGIFRGLHFQKGYSSQAKIVEVLQGSVVDFIVDLNPSSDTYQCIGAFKLYPNDSSLYVPRGFGHGFLALEDNTIFQYYIDNDYDPQAESGVRMFCDERTFDVIYNDLEEDGINDNELQDMNAYDHILKNVKLQANDRDMNWQIFNPDMFRDEQA